MWRWRSIKTQLRTAAAACASGAPGGPPSPLALDERAVLADQELEVRAFLVGELEKDLLALGVLELLAVSLEEAVRAALALDADHQRLAVVDAVGQPLGSGGEQPVGRALEEEERRLRLELRVLLQQLAVARLERAEVLLLLVGELLEDAAAARVAGDAGGAGVELEAAPFGGDRDAQRIARKQQLGRAAFDRRRTPGAAGLARAVDLQHALPRR